MIDWDYISGLDFGIYGRCEWLKNEFLAGRVAVIANSFCSRNRRHDQSQLNANTGEPAFDGLYYDRDGWGGRLAEHQNFCACSRRAVGGRGYFGNETRDGFAG